MKLIIVILLVVILCGAWINEAECSIILKSMVINPSKTKTQEAMLKAYLPKEAVPEDIVDLGDLKIDYDITKALYYVYKGFELAPGESASRSIEIKDIWVISGTELDSLTGRAKELAEALKKTAYFDTAITLQKDIEQKSSDILSKQEKAMDATPQTHIAVYRDNQKALDTIKNVLAELEKMKTRVVSGPPPGRVSVRASWWLILGVIIALGLFSFIFFIIWQRQAIKLGEKEEKSEEPSPLPKKTEGK
jgi:hypothetical protein